MGSGCGPGLKEFPTAETRGVVTCNGVPVPNVRVYFAPQAKSGIESGKSGWGTAQADGTFVISTYGDEDGAVVGTHRVLVGSPHPERFPDFECDCETNGNLPIMTVEVEADTENNLSIELLPKSSKGRGRPVVSRDDLDDVRASD